MQTKEYERVRVAVAALVFSRIEAIARVLMTDGGTWVNIKSFQNKITNASGTERVFSSVFRAQ